MGYTNGQRLPIFELRPAPVQVTWIGFAGTVGGGMDYIVADKVGDPAPGRALLYRGSAAHARLLPGQRRGARAFKQADHAARSFGIPEDAIVFCCFNQTAKITPPMVDLWVEILRAVPGSILWLWKLYPAADDNLRATFRARGGDASQLYFGATLPGPEHLSRYELCDLFLDTYPYGGHGTASNALFGACPVLALPGQTFASRVSSSLLSALGLQSLIAASPQDYVTTAVRIGTDPVLRRALKQRLVAARKTSPLFDGAHFANNLERAFIVMLERFDRGEKPRAIDL